MKRKTKKTLTNTEHYYLNEQGLETIKDNLEGMRAKRKEQVVALTTIREQQSDEVKVEDAGFIYAMGVIEFVDHEIDRLENILAHARIIAREHAEAVALGSRVKLESKGRSFEYTIVQSFEADPSIGKISTESPLGKQLLGKRLWEKITFKHSKQQKPLSLKLVAIQ